MFFESLGYLIQAHWGFLLAALIIGLVTGWFSCSAPAE